MEIYLRQRSGIVCLITIALLLVFSHLYNHSSASRRFRRMCIYALCHVVLTILTEVTANLLDTTPLLVNRLLYLLCCATAIAFLGEMCWYIASITPLQGRSLQAVRIVTILIPFLFLFAAPLFPMHFTQGLVINYPDGAFMHLYFFIGIVLCLVSAVLLFRARFQLDRLVCVLMTLVLVLMAAMTCLQMAFPELMLSAVKLTVITLMMYFIVENPVGTYHDRAMIDLPTGLRNHNALQEDAVNLANNWQLSSNGSIGVVACDLNDLKRINDTHGHQAGDEAIALIGRVLRAELVSAYGVYRTGGDEFTAIYVNQHEDVMIAEMQAARDNLRSRHLDCGWAVHAALGSAYATSQSKLSIRDIMQRADEAMYADKARQKGVKNVRR